MVAASMLECRGGSTAGLGAAVEVNIAQLLECHPYSSTCNTGGE
jgi:hypothetical protein